MGRIPVNVTVEDTTRRLNLYVVEGDYDSFFGREWLVQFINEINFTEMFAPSDLNNINVMSPDFIKEQTSRLEAFLKKIRRHI